MATTCLKCGSQSWDNAFVDCTKCEDCVVHRYCLDIIPDTVDEYVTWYCEDCQEDIAPSTEEARGSGNSMENKQESRLVPYGHDCVQGHLIHSSNGALEKLQTSSDYEENSRLICNTARNSDICEKYPGNPTPIRQDHHIPAQPVEDPIWRGNFVVINEKKYNHDGFVAHISNKACSKVCEEARSLNKLLHFEMHPISDVWPKSFQKSAPSDENIALYFLPADKGSEKVFDNLVHYMIACKQGLKATIENAELLLFTSVELPLLYWKFQGRHYLWGVFRGKQAV